jgi:hypothetical protein
MINKKSLDNEKRKELRERLESKEKFLPLLNFFVEKSIIEEKENDKYLDEEINFSTFYEAFITSSSRINYERAFKYSESPIERMFLSSLILLFIRNRYLYLNICKPSRDVENEIKEFRERHLNIMTFAENYQKETGDIELKYFEGFFKGESSSGFFTQERYDEIEYHRIFVKNFLWDSYFITPQAQFPNYKIDNKSIRVDLLIWSPSNENIKLVVECDGFKYHKSKEVFESDKKRDRLLQSKGYQVLRFSGSEIFRDTVKVSEELFDFIENL